MKYADAGVDIDKAEKAMQAIKEYVKDTYNSNVMAEFGSFGGLFSLANLNLKEPILVSSVDGVGTKLKIGIDTQSYVTVGQDIVNHCVDDILVQGAKPLFFLDYFATGVLEEFALAEVVRGLSIACKENGCALLGGETAEMPGFYKKGDFDLAGTIVGVAERSELIDGKNIAPGDVALGLSSSGLHTNGYSLARKVLFEKMGYTPETTPPNFTRNLGEVLTTPHRSYLGSLFPLVQQKAIKGMIHITGGGFQGNIPRVLPENVRVSIDTSSWETPEIFKLIQTDGEVEFEEMHRTFNMGIGMVLIISSELENSIVNQLTKAGETVCRLGSVSARNDEDQVQLLR